MLFARWPSMVAGATMNSRLFLDDGQTVWKHLHHKRLFQPDKVPGVSLIIFLRLEDVHISGR